VSSVSLFALCDSMSLVHRLIGLPDCGGGFDQRLASGEQAKAGQTGEQRRNHHVESPRSHDRRNDTVEGCHSSHHEIGIEPEDLVSYGSSKRRRIARRPHDQIGHIHGDLGERHVEVEARTLDFSMLAVYFIQVTPRCCGRRIREFGRT